MRKRNYRGNKKERILMVTASAMVLGILTTTGLVMREEPEKENIIIDFSTLEERSEESKTEVLVPESEEAPTQEANANQVLIPALDIESVDAGEVKESGGQEPDEEAPKEQVVPIEAKETSAFTGSIFKSTDTLQWPIVGNVVLNYSMDQTTYFETLNQYKYNPAIIIEAVEGELITSASQGIVESVYYNEEIGNAIQVKIDDSYTIIYGQLDAITVEEGDLLEKGTVLGEVASPTKYYTKEGCNVYFELRENGVPINPMSRME